MAAMADGGVGLSGLLILLLYWRRGSAVCVDVVVFCRGGRFTAPNRNLFCGWILSCCLVFNIYTNICFSILFFGRGKSEIRSNLNCSMCCNQTCVWISKKDPWIWIQDIWISEVFNGAVEIRFCNKARYIRIRDFRLVFCGDPRGSCF